jgi:PKD repeat protein
MIQKTFACIAAIVTLAMSGCALDGVEQPALSGPSDFGLAVTLAAVPDSVPRDGNSQSVVTVTARGPNGQPMGGQRLSVMTDVGSISTGEVTTGADGRATFTFTAPSASALGNAALIRVLPVGTNAETAEPRTLTIRFTGVSNTTVPTALFTVTPTSPEVNQLTTLDASTTTDEGAPCGDACTYAWDFGGEATEVGRIVTYRFQRARIYNVALTVTDAAGSSATTRTNVTVTAAPRPTVSIAVSPTSPTAGQQATFTANTTVAPNHSLTDISWNFGDGTTMSTTNNSIVKTFASAGTFIVTATVTDDLGRTASATTTVTVGNGITFPSTAFTVSPTAPESGDPVIFTAGDVTTTGGATIVQWQWNFGDGSDVVSETDASTSHTFPVSTVSRTYVVRLTVTDSQGRTATASRDITVAP